MKAAALWVHRAAEALHKNRLASSASPDRQGASLADSQRARDWQPPGNAKRILADVLALKSCSSDLWTGLAWPSSVAPFVLPALAFICLREDADPRCSPLGGQGCAEEDTEHSGNKNTGSTSTHRKG